MLNPAPAQLLTPSSNGKQSEMNAAQLQFQQQQKQHNVGATWSNSGTLNIDLDNLLMNKQNKQGTAPSMNQLAVNPTTNQPRTMVVNSSSPPVFGGPINFNHAGFAPAVNANMMQTNNQFFPAFK